MTVDEKPRSAEGTLTVVPELTFTLIFALPDPVTSTDALQYDCTKPLSRMICTAALTWLSRFSIVSVPVTSDAAQTRAVRVGQSREAPIIAKTMSNVREETRFVPFPSRQPS